MNPSTLSSRATALAAGILALTFTSGGAAAAGSEPPEISFNVKTIKEVNVEGPDVERTYFMAGAKRIAFGQPKGCRLSVDGGGFVILLNDLGLDGEIHITRSEFTPELALAENALQYRDAASKGLPQGATDIEVLQPVLNPYPYNGWKSLGFTWNYSFPGRSMTRTVSYINLEVGAQIVVTTLASKRDEKKVGEIVKQFLSSWWVMDR